MGNYPQDRKQNAFTLIPSLSEFAEAAKTIIRELYDIGASPGEIIGLLRGDREPPDSSGTLEPEDSSFEPYDFEPYEPVKHRYTAYQIARELGIYSIYGRPHAHAVSAILNYNILIEPEHTEERMLFETSNIDVYYTLYDWHALEQAQKWVEGNGYPYEIDGFSYTYHVLYGKRRA